MKLSGTFSIGSQLYFVLMNETKSYVTYTIFNRFTKSDSYRHVMGETPQDIVLKSRGAFEKYADARYLRCHMKRMRTTGVVTASNALTISEIERFLDVVRFATMYSFSANNILGHSERNVGIDKLSTFSASDRNLTFAYEKKNNEFQSFSINYKDVKIDMQGSDMSVKLGDIEMVQIARESAEHVIVSTLKTVTYQTLCDVLDMSWFEEDGVRKKDYKAITTVEDFESLIIAPLAKAVQFIDGTGDKLLLSIDTETTGLNVYNLSEGNPDKSHCVAIPIAWEDNKAFVIFTDMEHFDSIPNRYAMERLAPFITKARYNKTSTGTEEEIRSIQLFRKVTKEPELKEMDVFSTGQKSSDAEATEALEKDRVVSFRRSAINLVGHNVTFDGRVFFDYGVRPWFDDDTQQMAFVLSPKLIRGSKKLKMLTRKLLKCETPELEDILGKGNEDKYRYLTEKLVAEIYGCADADFTRLVFKALRGIMSDELYSQYRKQDVPMLNILYEAEYNGMNSDQKALFEMAQHSQQNLEILRNFMYDYVGRVVATRNEQRKLKAKLDSGILTKSEYSEQVQNISLEGMDCRFEFEIKASSIRDVIYGILGYKVFGYTEGDSNGNNKVPKTDKFVMKKLASCKIPQDARDSGHEWKLQHDVLASGVDYAEYEDAKEKHSKRLSDMVLVNADEFNSCRYPLAIVLSKYAVLNKEYTSYFKPILDTNMEGKIFKNFSLARIETRRIMNPGQTMKGTLKALIKPYSDDYYLLDFDMAQVEYRIMASLAEHTEIIHKMMDPEKDYHIETAAIVWRIPPYKVDKKLRKQTKSVGFGVPYGLSVMSLAETLFGAANDDTIFETQKLLLKWEASNKPIMDFLERQRDKALLEWKLPDNLREFMDAYKREVVKDVKGKIISNEYVLDAYGNKVPAKVGRIANRYGFYRTFDLENMDNRKESSIRRKAGNYPIQSYAAELFRKILIRFYEICEEYGIQDKIKWHMLIHDELLCSVHKSVHPFLIYKLVMKACMIRIKGHTNYFVGINVGNTWGEVKDDAREAPVYFVKRMIDRYDRGEFKETWIDDAWEYVKPYRAKYIEDRIGEVLRRIIPDLDTCIIDANTILEKMDNYTVRSYVGDCYKENRKIAPLPSGATKEDEEYRSNEVFISKLESWLLDVYGTGRKIRGQDGSVYTVERGAADVEDAAEEIDYTELFDDEHNADNSYWSFDATGDDDDDDGSLNASYDGDEALDALRLDLECKGAKTVADVIVKEEEYDNLMLTPNQIIIRVEDSRLVELYKKALIKYVTAENAGKSILFKTSIRSLRWIHVKDDVDLHEIDSIITKCKQHKKEGGNNGVRIR